MHVRVVRHADAGSWSGTELVSTLGVRAHSRALPVVGAFWSLACGGMAASPTTEVVAEQPSVVHEAPPPGIGDKHALLWLHPFDDSVAVSAIALTPTGDVLVARSGAELADLDAHGALRWARPFGELVATSG